MRAYKQTRIYMNEAPAIEIAEAEKSYFPDIDETALADCIGPISSLAAGRRMSKSRSAAYEKTLDVFEYVGLLNQRYRYEQVCAAPPATDQQ